MEDRQFVMQTTIDGLAKVEFGGLAMDKAGNSKIRELAQRIVLHSCQANVELTELAKRKGIDVPGTVDTGHRIMMSRLRRLVKDEFDRAFMKAMIEDHRRSISSAREEVENGEDPEIKAFALKWLRSLENHYEMAESLLAA